MSTKPTYEELEKRINALKCNRDLAAQILETINISDETTGLINKILFLIKKNIDFESIGIRLQENGDFPYYDTDGFSKDFVEAEKNLCTIDRSGKLTWDPKRLKCMCGKVLVGNINPALSFFTEGGSFWTNSITEFISSTENEGQDYTLDRCFEEGHETMALIPLRVDNQIIGLLQLNDRRKDKLTLEMISFLEKIVASIVISFKRKQNEEALMEGEARFKGIFEYTKNGVAVYRAVNDGDDFIFVDFNKAGEKIEKIKRDDLKGKSVVQVFPSVKEFGLFDVFKRVWKTGIPEHHPISTYKDERISGWRDNFVFKLPSGEIVAVYSDETERKQSEEVLQKAYDELEKKVLERTAELKMSNEQMKKKIEERKQVEKTLRQSEEKYSNLFRYSNDGIFIHDIEGKLLDINQKALDQFGYTRSEMFSLKIPDLHPTEALEKSKWAFDTIIKEGFVRFGIEFKKKNGEVFSAEVSSSLFNLGNKKVIQGISRDITKRKQAERELRIKDYIIESASSVIATADLDGKMAYVNPIFLKIWGFQDVTEVIGKHFQEFWLVKDRLDEIIHALENEGVWSSEIQAKKKDGAVFDVQVYAAMVFDKGGKPVCLMSSSVDITDRKNAEKEKEKLIKKLQDALNQIQTLEGILPICSYCKKIKDDKGYWEQFETYIHKHSHADFSHGICPLCMKKHYPKEYEELSKNKNKENS